MKGHVFWFMGMVNLKAINSKKKKKKLKSGKREKKF